MSYGEDSDLKKIITVENQIETLKKDIEEKDEYIRLLEVKLNKLDISNSVFCPNCKTSDKITVDNWCMRCGTVLKKNDC